MEVNKDKTIEREAYMGFKLSKDIQEKVVAIVSAKNWDQEQAVPIPDADGMILVKEGSPAFLDRKGNDEIFMIPVKMKGMSSGVEVELNLFVCTK
jgi:hypothetical protein